MLDINTVILNEDNFRDKFYDLLEPLDENLVEGEESKLNNFIDLACNRNYDIIEIVEEVLYYIRLHWINSQKQVATTVTEHGNDVVVSVSIYQ